jgi:SAM-dependent methyltransferase
MMKNDGGARCCPICQSDSKHARLFLEGSIDRSKLSEFSFASRKEPEFMSHRLVQCSVCDLVYVDMPPAESELAHAYHAASYDSSEEADDAATAYIRAIRPTLNKLATRRVALEIGTGTGIFLDHLSAEGFEKVIGVEPSHAAIAAAPEHRRKWIREGMFNERDFAPGSFDLICCFMTMEHVQNPEVLASSALRLLRPGGAFVTVTHDYRSLVNRVLGKRSPIIDVEHMQLFSKRSVRCLFEHAGFAEVSVGAFVNTYAIRYWTRLAPIPKKPKRLISRMMSTLKMDRVKCGFNVGNMITSGFRRS